MKDLLNYIRSLTEFSEESWRLLQPALTEKQYAKSAFLLREGEVCTSLFYIEKGYCKSYYEMDGTLKNIGFYFENEIATNIKSFGSGEKSEYNMVACEPLTAISFNREKLFEIAKQAPEIEILGRHCIREFASKQEAFSNLLQLYSAEKRLEYLENNHPDIMQRVPLSQLASFLGVARETLSRIRSQRMLP